jgi:hypothetical protein
MGAANTSPRNKNRMAVASWQWALSPKIPTNGAQVLRKTAHKSNASQHRQAHTREKKPRQALLDGRELTWRRRGAAKDAI